MGWYVYMLRCGDGSLYTGITDDVQKRLAVHRAGKGAKYTRGRGPLQLAYTEEQPDKSCALRRELAIKRLCRGDKLKLCASWQNNQQETGVINMKEYKLKNESWECRIVPEIGANVISLCHREYEILRVPESENELRADPVLYGVPVLLPPNRTAGGRFAFEGKEYELAITEPEQNNHLHGHMHSAPFQVIEQTESSLHTQLVNDGTLFPFKLCVDMWDKLEKDGWHRTVTVTNTGKTAMPLVLAFHFTFKEPESFCVPLGLCWEIDENRIPTGVKMELTQWQNSFVQGVSPNGRDVDGFYEMAGDTAYVGDYLLRVEGFDQWVLYNGGGDKGFLCVEPQLGPVNALNSGGYQRLEPGEKYTVTMEITRA